MRVSASTVGVLAVWAGAVDAANVFGTTPFSDSLFQGPQVRPCPSWRLLVHYPKPVDLFCLPPGPLGQTLPGPVKLAYFDLGGAEVAYHSYDNVNHGSCELNPCDGQYKNMFRKVSRVLLSSSGSPADYPRPPSYGGEDSRFCPRLGSPFPRHVDRMRARRPLIRSRPTATGRAIASIPTAPRFRL
jgi:hypothetical protein